MNQGRLASLVIHSGVRAIAAAAFVATLGGSWPDQGSDAYGQTAPRRRLARASDGPNQSYDSDAAAVNFVDGLFNPDAPSDPLTGAAGRALGVPSGKAAKRPAWSGRLVRNPKQGDGNPPYALIDEYGGIRRYVETSPNVALERYVGKTVTVRRDTGATLLATQLDLPRMAPIDNQRLARDLAGGARTRSQTAGSTTVAAKAAFTRPRNSGVQLAAVEEPMPALEPVPADSSPTSPPMPLSEGEIVEGEMMNSGPEMSGPVYDEHGHMIGDEMGYDAGYEGVADPLYLDNGLNFGGCPTCGDSICGGCGCALGGCGVGSRPIWYVRGEYLLWWFEGMEVPPLVVRGAVNNNGTPSVPTDDFFDDASVVYGGTPILEDARSGYRIKLGYWLDDCGKWAIEGDYMGFGTIHETFTDGGNGTTPIVGRPFIDASTGLDAVEDVSFPGIAGTVTVNSSSRFQTAGVRLRKNLCCVSSCDTNCGDCVTCGSAVGGCDSCNGCDAALFGFPCLSFFHGGTRHVDILYGFRWAELEENIHINEDLITISPSTPVGTTIDLNDRFDTQNTFLGGELGFLWEWQKRRWSLEIESLLGIGSTEQQVRINGDTTTTDPGVAPDTKVGGLYTQNTNIGTYSRDVFSVMPQIGFTGGYSLTERLRLTGGYRLLYWSRVVRPGDIIDTRVNPNRLDYDLTNDDPPDDPRFVWRDSDLWGHGLNVGLDYSW